MKGMTVCLLFAFTSILGVLSLDIRLPPSIVQSPIELKIYRSDDEVVLDCVASGFPKPEYEWRKDGMPLSLPNVQQISEGTIKISPITSFHEGSYQCTAANQHGRTMSRPTMLQRAVLSSYSPSIPIFQSPMIEEGKPYTLYCQETKCYPQPMYSWAISLLQVDTEQAAVMLSKRIQVDEYGHLHFSYVTMADAQNSKLYKCNLYNPYLDVTKGGSYSKLNVKPVGGLKPFPPVFMFGTKSPLIALEGRNVSLRCFFAGYPDPLIQWTTPSRSLVGRYQWLNYNTELMIRNIQSTDEGVYTCTVQNGDPNTRQKYPIQVEVHAVPVFLSIMDKPHNMNATEGQSVSVRCKASAKPEAKITWFINGEELDRTNLPPRFHLSADDSNLTISKVCRDCLGGTSDIRVIQCNASNLHGSVFSDGYINILKETVISQGPVDVMVTGEDLFASFNCSAISDDSTPVTVNWYRFTNEEIGFEPVHPIPGRVILENNGTLSFRVVENTTDWLTHEGIYKCVSSNGYSNQTATAVLTVESVTGPPVILPAAAGFDWWIFLIIAIILLLLLLLILCCCCLYRNKGETYLVDKKERKNGHNPEKELADSGFHDYIRPEKAPIKGSRASLASSLKTHSDDEMSLNEYGDIDAGKFTEDGSFIGDYGNRAYV